MATSREEAAHIAAAAADQRARDADAEREAMRVKHDTMRDEYDAMRAERDAGDLHWANLAGPEFTLLDWEMWGVHPTGSDEAMLYLRSLLVPATADRVHSLFADVLDSPAGQAAQIRAAAALLHRADEHPDLVDAVRQHVRPLLNELAPR